jgi:tripartite-type tricarboxylate transporter receptor subunit TctC
LAPVSLVSRFPFFMFVPNSSPAKSVMEFIAYAKAHPGKVTLAAAPFILHQSGERGRNGRLS